MSDIDKLRRDVDNIEENVITDKIDYYTQMGNPTTKNHESFALYGDGDGWVLDDDGDRIYKQSSDDRESLRVLFNRYPELEFKEVIGVRFRFKLKNCSLTGVGLGDGTVMDYVHDGDSTEVISSASYVPLSEEEYESGLHSVPLIRTVNDTVLVGYDSYNWGFDNDEIKDLLYEGYPVLEIIVEPDYTFAEVEVSNLTMEVYFESSMSREINVIENRLEEINLPEMVLKQSDKSYLYFRAKELLSSSTLTAIRDYVNRDYGSTVFDGVDYVPKSTTLDGVGYVFSNDTLYVDDEYPVVYVAVRTKFNDSFGRYRDFNIESTLGVGGSDTVEYRYAYRTQNNATVDVDPTSIDGSTIPTGWSETMESVNATNRWCFRTTATKTNGKWSNWSSPVLVGYYAKDGVDGKDGKDGAKGEKGEKGDKGDKGDKGADGKDGKDGVDGAKGDKGDKGADGKDGKDGVDGAKGDKGDKGTDGNTVLSLYINGTDTPTAPSIVKGTIKDINGVAYTDYEVTPDTIQELFNIIKKDTGSLSEDLIGTDLTDKYGDLYMAYKDWSVEPLPATDQLNTYVTVMNYNPSSADNNWGTPTLYALATATVTGEDTGSSNIGSISLVPDNMDTVPLGNYTTMNLYRFGSLVLCRVNYFTIQSPSNKITSLGTVSDEIYEEYNMEKFYFTPNTVGANTLSMGAYFIIDKSTKEISIKFNDDNFNKNKTKKAYLQGEKVWVKDTGTATEVNLTVTGTKPTITVETGGRLYVTFYGDGTDTVRDGKTIINQLVNKNYTKTIFKHDKVKTFYKADGTSFDTSYYTEQIINLNPDTYSNQKSTFAYDGTYKTTYHEYNLKVIKLKLKVTAVKLSNNMVRFKLTDSAGELLLSTRLNIMTWSDTTGYHEKVGHSKGYIDVPCNAQAGLMVMGNNDDNGKLLCESLNGKTWSSNSVTKNGTTCLTYFVKLSDLTTE